MTEHPTYPHGVTTRLPRVYAIADRPDVEVLVDGIWCPGQLRMWAPEGQAGWLADVQYQPPGTHNNALGTFTPEQVRADTVDRSRGRSVGGPS